MRTGVHTEAGIEVSHSASDGGALLPESALGKSLTQESWLGGPPEGLDSQLQDCQ